MGSQQPGLEVVGNGAPAPGSKAEGDAAPEARPPTSVMPLQPHPGRRLGNPSKNHYWFLRSYRVKILPDSPVPVGELELDTR